MSKKILMHSIFGIVLATSLQSMAAGVNTGGANSGGGNGGNGANSGLDDIKLEDSQNLVDLTPAQIETNYQIEVPSPSNSGGTVAGIIPSDLMNAWLAPNSGITYSNLSYVGTSTQAKIYSQADSVGTFFGNSGIVLSTGDAVNAPGSNTSTGYTGVAGTAGNYYVSSISNQFTYDSNSLKMTFTVDPSMNAITTKFVFASEEYPEWTGIFKDGFAFVVDGKNYAKLDPNNFVVLNDLPQTLAGLDSGDNVFLNNNQGATAAPFEYDGYTGTLTVRGFLDQALSTHTLEVVIADSGDALWDSTVFISGLQAANVAADTALAAPVPEPETFTMMLAGFGLMGFMARRRKNGQV